MYVLCNHTTYISYINKSHKHTLELTLNADSIYRSCASMCVHFCYTSTIAPIYFKSKAFENNLEDQLLAHHSNIQRWEFASYAVEQNARCIARNWNCNQRNWNQKLIQFNSQHCATGQRLNEFWSYFGRNRRKIPRFKSSFLYNKNMRNFGKNFEQMDVSERAQCSLRIWHNNF